VQQFCGKLPKSLRLCLDTPLRPCKTLKYVKSIRSLFLIEIQSRCLLYEPRTLGICKSPHLLPSDWGASPKLPETLPIRFWNNCRICKGSASDVGWAINCCINFAEIQIQVKITSFTSFSEIRSTNGCTAWRITARVPVVFGSNYHPLGSITPALRVRLPLC